MTEPAKRGDYSPLILAAMMIGRHRFRIHLQTGYCYAELPIQRDCRNLRSRNGSDGATGRHPQSPRLFRRMIAAACNPPTRRAAAGAVTIASLMGESHANLPKLDWCNRICCSTVACARGCAGARRNEISRLVGPVDKARPVRESVGPDQTSRSRPTSAADARDRAVLQASLADQAAGGQGGDTRYTCVSTGMPRIMTPVRPIEFVVLPDITYVMFENNMPRRIYTNGREFPKDDEPSYAGYSIGNGSTRTWMGASTCSKSRPVT